MAAAAILLAWCRPLFTGIFASLILFVVLPLLAPTIMIIWSIASGRPVRDLVREHLTLFPVLVDARPHEKDDFIPWATYGLVLFNVLAFVAQNNPSVPLGFVNDNLLFVPMDPKPWNMVVGLFTGMALHANLMHLVGNMAFLWPVASAVERRTGSRTLLVAYVLSGLAGNVLQAGVFHFFYWREAHGLGASGAVFGIMGVYAVRCYHRTIAFPVPILGSLVFFRLELNAIMVMGLYFLQSYQLGMRILAGGSSRTGHWAHFGGMCVGILVALGRRLGSDAVREKRLELGENAAARGLASQDAGEGEEALRAVLSREPGNLDALVHMAHLTSRAGHRGPGEDGDGGERYGPARPRLQFAHLTDQLVATREGARWYREALRRLPSKDPRAAALFREFVTVYQETLEPGLHYRLAGLLAQTGDRDAASRALELLLASPGLPDGSREQALVQQVRLLAALGHAEAAQGLAQQLLEDFPESRHAAVARTFLQGGRPT
jgi:membrane associated rhomboid family serine protease/TolA-binding protein